MLISILLFLVGLALLLGGGFALVPGTVSIARKAGIPARLIAAVIIAGATSAPELLVSIDAALSGNPDISWGNILGSNIANILLVLGLGLLVMPVMLGSRSDRLDMLFLTAITLLVAFILIMGGFDSDWSDILPGRRAPIILGGALFLSLIIFLSMFSTSETEDEDTSGGPDNVMVALLYLLGGLAALIFGADLMVNSAVLLATDYGISQAVIGVTIVAVGTSLPEITAVIASMLSRRSDIALGNVVGSNLFNLCIVLGATAVTAPLPASPALTSYILLFFVMSSLVLMALCLRPLQVGKATGGIFITAYAGFVFLQFF